MALGKAVLGSSVGGIRELVEHETTGLLFTAEDIPDFCSQAERLLRSVDLRRQLGINGREYILREKDWAVLAHNYQLVYRYALEHPAGHRRITTEAKALA